MYQILKLQEYRIFHLTMVSSMVALVVASRYSKTVATFTKQNATKKSGLQLKLHLIFACYFIVPLCHWIWLYGGLQNRVVMVNTS